MSNPTSVQADQFNKPTTQEAKIRGNEGEKGNYFF
jgi:hypothetical protein